MSFIFAKISVMLKNLYYTIILFGCGTKVPSKLKFLNIPASTYELDFFEKAQYLFKLVLTFTPIAYVLNTFNAWIPDNKIFFQVLVWAIIVNIAAGARVHWVNNTFKIKTLLLKNIEMCFIILLTYPILEGINRLTGDNMVGNIFQWGIQIGTILYPGSKAIKNIHIWSEGKYPPKFIMEKIYKFEKDGDVNDLLNRKEA